MSDEDIRYDEHPFKPKTAPKPMAPNAYQAYIHESLASFAGAAEEINRMTAKRIRQVPELYFRTKLLAIVRAWVTKAQPEPDIRGWLNVADGLHNPIEVVNDQKEILFVVPPAFVDIQMNTTDHRLARKQSIIHAVNIQGVYADNGDRRQFWDMETALLDDNQAKPAEHSMAAALTQLVKMYKYYNLPLVEILGEEGAAQIEPLLAKEEVKQTSLPSNGSDDDEDAFDY